MNTSNRSLTNTEGLGEEVKKIWDTNAEWWDDKIGDGNEFQVKLIEPATEHLLELKHGDTVLDIACGAGRFARRMAEMGAQIVAFDFSAKFIARAIERTKNVADSVEYHIIDASDQQALLALGTDRFDWAVCTMALMDMATIDPLMSALGRLLKKGGRFVFSVIHPCFHSAEVMKFSEGFEIDGRYVVRNGVKIWRYLTSFANKVEGIIGQPEPHYNFHRSLNELFRSGFQAGFVIDGFEEPRLDLAGQSGGGLHWRDMPEIPPILVVRMLKIDSELNYR